MKLYKIKNPYALIEYLTQRGIFVHRYKVSHQRLRRLSKKLQPTLEGVTAHKDGWYIPRQPKRITPTKPITCYEIKETAK